MKSKYLGRKLIALLVIAVCIVLAGCGKSDEKGNNASPAQSSADPAVTADASPSDSEQPVELQVWTDNPANKDGWDAAAAEFTKLNPNIKVSFTHYPSDQYATILRTAIQGGTVPDLFRTNGFNALQGYVDMDAVMVLDGQVDVSAFDSTFLKASILGGKLYATPGFSKDVLVVYYNKDLFAAHGIEIPKSYDEFLAACETLKAAGVIPIAYGGKDTTSNIFAAYTIAPSILTPQWYEDAVAGAANFKDSRFVKSLSVIKEFADKQYYGKLFQGVSFDAAKLSFQQGKSAMLFNGSWDNASIKATPNLNYGAFYFPPLQAGDPVVGAANNEAGLSVYSKTKSAAAAIKFAQFVSSKAFYQLFDEKMSLIPPLKDVEVQDQIFQDFNAADQWMTFYFVHFNKQEPTPQTLMVDGMQAVFSGKKTIEEVAGDVQDQVDKDFPELKK